MKEFIAFLVIDRVTPKSSITESKRRHSLLLSVTLLNLDRF